ncbi:glycoside hydrolase family 3 protein [Paractinoplanes toevensis]|uniref:beta-glucosidase n=1 Tax=Paractinoplanes toevensis TaxID=571911 RepID=A0A919TE36_9ACTN|nr:glycoside hydrolase family 3 protein [Actinoplanes toevensis]GIM93748.1 beta-glucosidase [Actinoplanes toevensis]
MRPTILRRSAAGAFAAMLLPLPAAMTVQTVTLAPARAVTTVDAGGTTSVPFTVTTSDGRALTAPATVGTLTFPAGAASGTVRALTVRAPTGGPSLARPLPLDLRASGAVLTNKPAVIVNAHGLPYLDSRLPVGRRVEDLLRRMTLDDKIGQMTQAERGAMAPDPAQVASLRLGSVLSGGGSVPTPNTPAAWVEMVNLFQAYALSAPLQIPMIYGIDAVHGHGNVYGATVFPHNVGLGAGRDPGLVERVYRATAAEVRATGIPWDFAPCVCVSRDERWGRSYESFAEDPALVIRMETAIDGLQDGGVLATVKHYAGDGDTEYGTGNGDFTIDQGITVTSRADFARLDLAPYRAAIRKHDAGSVMPSFSSVDWTEDGVGNPTKMHASRELITGTLKHDLGFDGLVISDWEGIHQIPDPSAPAGSPLPTATQVRVGVNAGTDMFMEPNTAPRFEELLRAEVASGGVPMSRIDDAVRRILRTKFEIGLFAHPYASAANAGQVGSAAHRALAREAVAESQVLLKNSGRALPLRKSAKIYVAGRNADDIGNQAGGWTIDWQGRSGAAIPGTTILQAIRQVAPQVTYSVDGTAPTGGADVGVVVVGETPYAEGFGDVGGPVCGWCTPPQAEPKSLTLQPGDRAVVDRVCSAVRTCVVLLVSGRPQVVTDQLGEIDALVASWLPGSEGAGVADVLFGKRPFTGRLPVSWPATVDQVPINVGDPNYQPLFPYGWGLRTGGGGSALDVLRDAAQTRVISGHGGLTWASDLAEADRAQTSGDNLRAYRLLRKVISS